MMSKLFKILTILAVIALYLSIRWSDYPVLNILPFKNVFIHKEAVDSSMLNIATGFLTGYFVYLLTVVIPEWHRKKPIQKMVYKDLAHFVNKSCYLLLLMCKNSSDEKQFSNIIKSTDTECFNNTFYSIMEEFDITAEADTLLRYKNSSEHLKWYEYLNNKYEDMLKDINDMHLVYHAYLEDDDLSMLERIIRSPYLDAFVGGRKTFNQELRSRDGKRYLEDLPLAVMYESDPNLSNIFRKIETGTCPILIDYVNLLSDLSNYLKKKVPDFDSSFAISRLTQKNFGQYRS